MGLLRKRDEEHDFIEGIQIIEAGDVPDDDFETSFGGDTLLTDAPVGDDDDDAGYGEYDAYDDDYDDYGAYDDYDAYDDVDDDADDEDVDDVDVPDGDDGKGDADDAPDEEDDMTEVVGKHAAGGTGRGKALYVVATVAVAAVALIVGYVVGSGTFNTTTYGVSSNYVTEDELDNIVATWSYEGTTYTITAQEAIESQYSLEAVEADDGTYELTDADTILTYVRNQILLKAAEDEGLSLTEDEVLAYAEETLGSSDYEEISEMYSVTEEQAEEIVTQMALIQALYDSVMPEIDATYPTAPTEPEDGDDDTASAEYAEYIIALLGDEWDAENDTWASTDGDYYAALGDEDFSSESATYGQALTAYYTAYILYSTAVSEASLTWTEYANELYGQADITLYGLYA